MSKVCTENLDNFVDSLTGLQIDRYGINKCITLDGDKNLVWLTVYEIYNQDDEFDEQLTFTPQGLLDFCKEVIRIADAANKAPQQ